jgi:hypothetical protein
MMYFTKLFRKYVPWDLPFTKNPTIHLGRWSIIHNTKVVKKRVDLANEDHCGPCGQYIITKIKKPDP